jgi:integrase/recombinase XerD
MIRRRAKAAGIKAPIICLTFRATGITAYLENGGILDHAGDGREWKPPHHKLYDRTKERLTLDEIGLCTASAVATLVSCLCMLSIVTSE